MKKVSAIFMAAVMMLTLCSCGSNTAGQDSRSVDDNRQTEIGLEETDAAEESGMEGKTEMDAAERNDIGNLFAVPLPEEFVLISGGTFQMGSPEEETSISAEESNYYGHYPYEIEDNYFS